MRDATNCLMNNSIWQPRSRICREHILMKYIMLEQPMSLYTIWACTIRVNTLLNCFSRTYLIRVIYYFFHNLLLRKHQIFPHSFNSQIMGIGISIFGMVPFGWRFIGTLFGVFMVPAVYLFAKRMLKYRWLAVVTSLLFVFDFMHYTQTRIATIDTYVTFFIIVI